MFGLSGVGKGWLAGQVRTVRPDVLHLEASALMRAAMGASGEALRTAAAGVVQDNQSRLVVAFVAARAGRLDRPVLFDGHSVIDNDHDLVEIPAAAIAALGACAIVFISGDPEVIRRRRLEDARTRPDRSAATLAHHQEQARAVARGFAQHTGVDFVEINAGDWQRLATAFDSPQEKTPTS
ncbi:AAA family ATPase [Caulobacter segnis]